MRFTLAPWSLGQQHPFNLSQLPGEFTARAAVALRRTESTSTLAIPIYTLGWREEISEIIIKHLAQGHKCHDQDSNPHSNDLTTRTWVWCSKQLLSKDIFFQASEVKICICSSFSPSSAKVNKKYLLILMTVMI